MSGIGLLNERPLHAALKKWYAQPGDRFEIAMHGFVIDIVRDDLLLEIQTGNFASIKSKLTSLVRSHPLRLVYPIPLEKWIVKPEKHRRGDFTRRKSPKRGRIEDVFWEMVSLAHLSAERNFSLEVLMTRQEEARRFEGTRRWRTNGWAVEERRLLEVVSRRSFQNRSDWLALLPSGLGSFTAMDLAESADIERELAQKMAYCLRHGNMVDLIGKRGRANLYRVSKD